MNKIISTKNLVKTFSNNGVTQTIIDNLDLEIYENDFTIIMGSSGAGKSTLMYSLSGMEKKLWICISTNLYVRQDEFVR